MFINSIGYGEWLQLLLDDYTSRLCSLPGRELDLGLVQTERTRSAPTLGPDQGSMVSLGSERDLCKTRLHLRHRLFVIRKQTLIMVDVSAEEHYKRRNAGSW